MKIFDGQLLCFIINISSKKFLNPMHGKWESYGVNLCTKWVWDSWHSGALDAAISCDLFAILVFKRTDTHSVTIFSIPVSPKFKNYLSYFIRYPLVYGKPQFDVSKYPTWVKNYPDVRMSCWNRVLLFMSTQYISLRSYWKWGWRDSDDRRYDKIVSS